ncbi:MAG: RNA degradosome polyphosphate kinase, partial [Anaerotignaceae bacterium]
TENIAIESIVGRFLEHSRMYSFGRGSEQKLYISSADLMTRNTERRIEVACPILDENIKQQINKIMEVTWMDNVKARILLNTGNYINKVDSHNPIDSQIYFIEEYKKKAMTMTEVVKPKTSLVEKFKKFFNK